MAPAYDEFELKERQRRSPSDAIISFPRIRRNRRTSACIAAVIVIGLYYLLNSVIRLLGAEGSRESKTVTPRIRFPYLYSTLSTTSAAGLRSWNQNVLFIAADLKAAGRLAVTACEMSKHNRVQVHFALLGDGSVKADDFQNLSGLGPESDCMLTFHDGTTMAQLTLPLLEKAVKYAMVHLHRFLHPQVMFIDTENENPVVSKALKETARSSGIPMIELPSNAAEKLRWMTRLGSQSLRAWNRPKVEVFIRCDKHHGNLERLLRSLQNADYFGIMPSRITIEVGTTSPLHPFTQEFIEGFSWPSRDRIGIRYPIFPPGSDSVSQAIHHVQSFYPADKDTGVLFLDPNVELSPYYFHWLHYATLEYLYAGYLEGADYELYGISLTTPKSFLNGTGPFNPNLTEAGAYLYATPSTEAVLFFPQTWKQFFTYFQWRIQGILMPPPRIHIKRNFTLPDVVPSAEFTSSWLLYFTEFAKARGSFMLYPNFGSDFDTEVLAICHSERPSAANYKMGSRNPGQNEQRLIQGMAILNSLPGWNLPRWIDHSFRSIAGEVMNGSTLEVAFHVYVSQCTTFCELC
ncbi:hypothetical protein EV426DRAFT_536801 [Tirmania nivea]|nr:hypothetical protein EV426DRAFT_536801 [Tirmania nivea]